MCVCGRRPSASYRTQQIYAARWMITHGQADASNQMISVRLMRTTNVCLMQVWHCELATSVTFRRLVKVSLVHRHFVNNTLYYFTGYCCISLCCLSYDVQTNCLWNVCSCTTYRPESTDVPAVVKVVCSKRRGALSGKRSPRPEGMGFLGRRATSPLPNSKGLSTVSVHDTLFTCHSFAITGYDSFWPCWTQIAAGKAQAKADGAESP